MNTKLALLAATVAVLCTGQIAVAAEPTPIVATQSVVAKPETIALARRYFEVIGFQTQLGMILGNLTGPDQLGARPDISARQREALVSSAAEAMDEAMPVMVDEAARITARTFTDAQLKEMIAFYETDSGKAITAKSPVMPPMANQLVLSFAPIIRADAVVRTCAKVDCGAEPDAKA